MVNFKNPQKIKIHVIFHTYIICKTGSILCKIAYKIIQKVYKGDTNIMFVRLDALLILIL